MVFEYGSSSTGITVTSNFSVLVVVVVDGIGLLVSFALELVYSLGFVVETLFWMDYTLCH